MELTFKNSAPIAANHTEPEIAADDDAGSLAEWTAIVIGKTEEAAHKAADGLFSSNKAAFKEVTSHNVVTACKSATAEWWDYLLTELDVEPTNKKLHAAVTKAFKQAFDAVAYKYQTGHDLPPSKDGYKHNTVRTIREATGEGDAALLFYRIKYWWRMASISHGGKKWIANSYEAWAEDSGINARKVRRCVDRLIKLGLIESAVYKFKGLTTLHVRLTETGEDLTK